MGLADKAHNKYENINHLIYPLVGILFRKKKLNQKIKFNEKNYYLFIQGGTTKSKKDYKKTI